MKAIDDKGSKSNKYSLIKLENNVLGDELCSGTYI